jgi:hypothetical protein
MNSPLFPTAPVEVALVSQETPEVLTGPMPVSLELMPRADGAERFAPLIARIDGAEAQAMSIKISDDDSPEIIKAKAAQARRLRLDIFRPSRVEADKLHADLKAGVLEIGRKLDKARADFRSRCERIEDHLAGVENELKRREEQAAATRLAERQAAIAPYAIPGLPLPPWPDDEAGFAEVLETQKELRIAWDSEQKRKAAEAAAEAERKRKEAEEAERKRQAELKEARAAKAKADAERRAAEEELKAERARVEAERKAAAEEQRKRDAEAAAERKLAAEERLAELRRIEAERAKEAKAQEERLAAHREALGKLPDAARGLANALRSVLQDLDDNTAEAEAALAYYDEIAANL